MRARGYTLVEIAVVILVLSALMVMTTARMGGVREGAREERTANEMLALVDISRAYYGRFHGTGDWVKPNGGDWNTVVSPGFTGNNVWGQGYQVRILDAGEADNASAAYPQIEVSTCVPALSTMLVSRSAAIQTNGCAGSGGCASAHSRLCVTRWIFPPPELLDVKIDNEFAERKLP